MHGAWLAKQADDEAKVIDVQIHQCASGLFGVEYGRYITFQVAVVAAAVLGIVGLHHVYGTQLGQNLVYLFIQRHIEQAECGQTKYAPLNGGIVEHLNLYTRCGNGLFHNGVVLGLQCSQRILVMHMIGVGNVDHVCWTFLQHLLIVCVHHGIGVSCALAQFTGFLFTLGAGEHSRHFNLAGKILVKHLHHFVGNLSGSYYTYFHVCSFMM